ncbi:hypothetical protein [Roseovarius sp. M141]|uniref:hypothetical protein n=1 Tax=Roseovarius sp. M141 TaxID=2583806 RepID=UPI0020CF4D15|nr:hypothetical protein [Roseovarius sp. M141]MCQ0090259.1 hypothetical protein [Roseovarius sp. M141]
MTRKMHPDSHELHDWPIYGPNDPEVALLVDRLGFDHGLRVREIEKILIAALRLRLTEEEQRETG